MLESDPVYLSVPTSWPTVRQLAAEGSRPAPDVEARIRALVAEAGEDAAPDWVHAEACEDLPDVTISDVAWVMVNH